MTLAHPLAAALVGQEVLLEGDHLAAHAYVKQENVGEGDIHPVLDGRHIKSHPFLAPGAGLRHSIRRPDWHTRDTTKDRKMAVLAFTRQSSKYHNLGAFSLSVLRSRSFRRSLA